MDLFECYNVDSGEGLKIFLEASGLIVEKTSGLSGSQNCIFLPDLTSFNLERKRQNWGCGQNPGHFDT